MSLNKKTMRNKMISKKIYIHHFKPGTQNTKFSEANVEGRAGEAAIGLFHYYNVYSPRQRCTIYLIVKFVKVREEFTNIVHRRHGCHLYTLSQSTETLISNLTKLRL